jgi:iron(III) transport system ATP-binding protein
LLLAGAGVTTLATGLWSYSGETADGELRATVARDVTAALRAAGATALLVTHDPDEAFVSADAIAVMHSGRVAQFGTPEAVYCGPADLEVARLTGPVLILDAVLEEGAR